MYKALVVDDEPRVRRGLKRLIPELDADWTVVGEAKNGVEALEMVKKYMPNLVITDIRMPNMNGLDLLNNLKAYPVNVVILSGYGYFEYAKTAIRFGAFDYLLKPLKPNEIRDLLSRLKLEIQEKGPQPLNYDPTIPYSKLWKDWLMGVEESADYAKKLQEQLPPDCDDFQMIAVDIDYFDELVTENQWGDRQLVLFAVRNIILEILGRQNDLICRYLFANSSQLYFLLSNGRCSLPEFESMIHEVKSIAKLSISVGISDEIHKFEQLQTLYSNAREALLNKWIYGNGKVYDYNDLFLTDKLQSGYPSDLDTSLIVSIREGQIVKSHNILDQFIDIFLHQNVTYQIFRRYCLQLLSSVVRVVYEQKITALVFQDTIKPYDLFNMNFTADEYRLFMKELISTLITSVEWKKQQKQNRTLENAVHFIHQQYANDLSLDDVSGHVNMSSSYFSSFFKQELGVTFIEYLTQLRMDKAKVLMMDPELKLYEISQMVGYQDVKYFSRLFKKNEGVAPGEYRQFFYRKDEEDAR